MKRKQSTLATLVALTLALGAGGAGAATMGATVALNAGNTSALGEKTGDSWVQCSLFCEGWNGKSWGPVATALGANPSPSSLATEFGKAVEQLGMFSAGAYTKIENGPDYGDDISTFVIYTEFFHVFDARDLFLFRTFDPAGGGKTPTPNPDRQDFTFFKRGVASSPSNVGATGAIAPIPLPAAGWLLLGGIGALGALAHRRRRHAG